MNTTIQIRIDSKTKIKAQRAFKKMGVSLSFGIKYFLIKVANAKNLKSISDLDALILEMNQELKRNY
jgi:addiction module RelB/DinJ family antitoxin